MFCFKSLCKNLRAIFSKKSSNGERKQLHKKNLQYMRYFTVNPSYEVLKKCTLASLVVVIFLTLPFFPCNLVICTLYCNMLQSKHMYLSPWVNVYIIYTVHCKQKYIYIFIIIVHCQ